MPESARAFMRHAFNQFYHDFANVDVKDIPFRWQTTYYYALCSYRDAILRYAMSIKMLHTHRTYSTLQETVPQEHRERYRELVDIGPAGEFALHTNVTTEIDRARAAHERHQQAT